MTTRRDLGIVALATTVAVPMAMTTAMPSAVAQQVDNAALLASLLKLESEGWQFLKDRDAAGAKDDLADDALLIFGDGTRYTKEQYLKAIPDFRLDSITIAAGAELKVWTADVATLLYRVSYAAAMKDAKATPMKAIASSTYVRRNGKWLSALYQETPVS